MTCSFTVHSTNDVGLNIIGDSKFIKMLPDTAKSKLLNCGWRSFYHAFKCCFFKMTVYDSFTD